MLALVGLLWAQKNHTDQLTDQQNRPKTADPRQDGVWEGMSDSLNEPNAAVESCEGAGMDAKIDDPFEMAIGRILGIGRAIPTNRHRV